MKLLLARIFAGAFAGWVVGLLLLVGELLTGSGWGILLVPGIVAAAFVLNWALNTLSENGDL